MYYTIHVATLTRAGLLERMLDLWGQTCPLCRRGQATNEHHIIPRSRTSRKHPAWWLNDERNLIVVCVECDSPMLHTPDGIRRCLVIQIQRYPGLDFHCAPWGPYIS